MMKAAIMVVMVTVVTVGGGEHTGDGGLSHQFLSYLRDYHWWFILFLNVMLLCKISIQNMRDRRQKPTHRDALNFLLPLELS